jgi:hypothetical protein
VKIVLPPFCDTFLLGDIGVFVATICTENDVRSGKSESCCARLEALFTVAVWGTDHPIAYRGARRGIIFHACRLRVG